ncbi:hypothetical protein A1O3_07903 [Capronia epimyces CBS 606.96]|uniref:Mso1 N-terminal domain-containing protein n=1 Tax=Capronia epimyces CBS 606.96 TaxID=1182542 RepID=W9YB73_9EURO|nr:uncharacterized protein A1O3_07903 [Capronia epimyces CBS 606.96]EXJ79624.1 hypothetical protein A1O3_07903 [Capronia epimyces CBS 606.96]
MASYLSYFTSHTASAPSSQASTPSATSTWSTTFSSRIATLRKALTKDSEEDDPDNEDCSHISNVLRAYYTEKGRPFPEWLPPDPKKPVTAPPQPQISYGQYGNTFGSHHSSQQTHSRDSSGGRGGGLSDLWDTTSAPAAPAPQTLRAARITPHSLRSHDSGRSQSSGGSQTASFDGPGMGARPLPSQRAGSHQTIPTASTAARGSRDRLRARLQGGGTSSGRSSPSAGLGSGGNGSQASYGAPGGRSGSQNRNGSSQPYVSASEPWATGSPAGDPYGYTAGSTGGGLVSNQYSNREQRHRPGGPR